MIGLGRRPWLWAGALGVLMAGRLALAEEPQYEAVVRPSPIDPFSEERAVTEVSRRELERRLPRSAPDALRWEPGVFVQQTAHGQGSAYIRGLTGQQTLLMFDGIRLNNSTYRQGPNQYFFTLDSRTIAQILVQRGGGSTRLGSDALGGAILVRPLEATLSERRGVAWEPRIALRGASADEEMGGRLQLAVAHNPGGRVRWGLLAGVGGRRAGLLRGGGAVENPDKSTPFGRLPAVPRLGPDGKTQLGTGFKELTADARAVVEIGDRHRLTAAAYLYRQYDAPRTDQCPPPTALYDTCLRYDEQFRHLVYVAWDGRGGAAAERARVSLSWQQQHERRRLSQTQQLTENLGVDDVDTLGVVANLETRTFRPRRGLGILLRYGLDNYVDLVRSSASNRYLDVDVTSPQSRGQYLDGSRYVYGGGFADLELDIARRVRIAAGARLGWAWALAPGDPESGSKQVDRAWVPVVGHVGADVRIIDALHLLANVDHSYRAPNLDDLTSRQQTGPGFQFENPALRPERATTFELGLALRAQRVALDVWGFETLLDGAMLKESRTVDECPPGTPACSSALSRFRLVNAASLSELRGLEGSLRVRGPAGLGARATLSYAWGESPRVGTLPGSVAASLGDRMPLSRVPPLNGTVELWWSEPRGITLGAALRWAADQTRLAVADYSDGRIPRYGTPGFAVVDLRASYRPSSALLIAAVVENVGDTAYRYHGSSVNGPGRGVMLHLEAALR